MRSTHRTGWSTSVTESAEAKTAASDRRSEMQVRKLWSKCAPHAPTGMADVCSRKCKAEGCNKRSSFGVVGKNCGVLCTSRTGGDSRRQEQKVKNRRLRQDSIVRCGRYKNGGVLCTSCTEGDGRRLQQKVQSRRLRQATVIRSCRYKNGGVLCAARTGRDGRRLQKKVQKRRLRQAIVV